MSDLDSNVVPLWPASSGVCRCGADGDSPCVCPVYARSLSGPISGPVTSVPCRVCGVPVSECEGHAGMHLCPGGCGVQLVDNMFACQSCRLLLPGPLRARLEAASPRRRSEPVEYREAQAACLSWYRTNPPAPPS